MSKEARPGEKVSVFWFRRDLRLEDNTALTRALRSGVPVLPVFIFDTQIIDELPEDDARVSFIYKKLEEMHRQLVTLGSSLHIFKGDPLVVWKEILNSYEIHSVYFNKDYEPYARERDGQIGELLVRSGISFHHHKDQVIFEEGEILKNDGQPYTVFTPYKRKWLERFKTEAFKAEALPAGGFVQSSAFFPPLKTLGFMPSAIQVLPYDLSGLKDYPRMRNFPGPDATSYLSPHLRFGTVSIRKLIAGLAPSDEVFLSELIWREFFMQIIFHFPEVVTQNFKAKYNGISWSNNPDDFDRWCRGETGYPMVDAGMRQLNESGYMHNRVRMVCASFLCKHLLTDWRMGEAYFARKLLDYELSSNNGNWQWAAGTGCDAAPYFRIFNPQEQLKKFDPDLEYVRRWVPEIGTPDYASPMVDHSFARNRALETYKDGFRNYLPEGRDLSDLQP